jgi:predicted phosphodiesterase
MSRVRQPFASQFRSPILVFALLAPLGAACDGGLTPEEGVQMVQQAATNGSTPTNVGLKVAFVGDTADGANWKAVLDLIKAEGAAAVVTAGDMTYDADPAGWWSSTESKLGSSFPVFLARGNHDDSSWSGFLGKAGSHLGGATRVNGPHNAAYKTIFRGLTLITIKKGDTGTTINNLVGSDNHIWRVCNWHQNQNLMQVGAKGNEMGWDVYETCRQQGAIIITGHEHSYERTKTMSDIDTQTIASGCTGGSSLCVGVNRTFVGVIGTGGTGLRNQDRCTPTSSTAPFPSLNTSTACKIWASIYTTDQGAKFGALFMTFNVDGNAKKARGYFKNINGQVIDSFTVFHD